MKFKNAIRTARILVVDHRNKVVRIGIPRGHAAGVREQIDHAVIADTLEEYRQILGSGTGLNNEIVHIVAPQYSRSQTVRRINR